MLSFWYVGQSYLNTNSIEIKAVQKFIHNYMFLYAQKVIAHGQLGSESKLDKYLIGDVQEF